MKDKLVLILGDASYKRLFKGAIVTNDLGAINHCDLLVLTGGEDVNPALYEQAALPTTQYNPARDTFEINMIDTCCERGVPVVGICRGAQLLHVYNGGTLEQHDPAHNNSKHKLIDMRKGVRFPAESDHHQIMLPNLTTGEYYMLATSEMDGSLDCLFYNQNRHLCVQYHPEWCEPASKARKYFSKLLAEYIWKAPVKEMPNFLGGYATSASIVAHSLILDELADAPDSLFSTNDTASF